MQHRTNNNMIVYIQVLNASFCKTPKIDPVMEGLTDELRCSLPSESHVILCSTHKAVHPYMHDFCCLMHNNIFCLCVANFTTWRDSQAWRVSCQTLPIGNK